MKTVKLYGEYYLVGLHDDKKEFLKDAEKDRTKWGYDKEIKEEYIKDGFLYGDFNNDEDEEASWFSAEWNPELFKRYSLVNSCYYIDTDDITEW